MTAPTAVAPALAGQIRTLLAEAEDGTVLAWWGNTSLPDGTALVPPLSQPAFEGAYLLLQNAGVGPGAVRPFAAVQALTRDLGAGDPVPVAIASFRMSVPHADVAQRVREAAAAGTALDPPPASLAEATGPRRFFAASAVLPDQWGRAAPVHRGREVRFVLDERFHLTSPGGSLPDAVEADLGDGRGFQTVAFGQPFGAAYPTGDAATVAIRCTYGEERLEARFTMAIADGPVPPLPDETWRLAGEATTGRGYVYRAPGHSDVVNPVIMVEGFPGGHPRDYLYELFDQAGTLEAMRARGYDVIVVGLDQGTDLVQRNAQVLEDCIRQARERTAAPLVVGGVSMGGLVSRLALAQMEKRGVDHGARLYVSIDAPHRGAYTSMGVQWFAQTIKSFAPAVRGFGQLLDAPSNQQIMIAWLHDGVAQVSPLREQLLADFEAAGGYPQKPRRIAVSCGRGDGVGGGVPPGALTLAWAGDPFVAAVLRTIPGESRSGTIATGKWFLGEPTAELPPLQVDHMLGWEGVPGGQATYNGQVAAIAAGIGCGSVTHDLDTTCSVPTISALDLDQDPHAPIAPAGDPFHAHVCSEANELHLTITPAVSNWLLSELGDPPMQVAATAPPTTTPVVAKFDPHDPGYLADPYPTYAQFRENSPVHCVRQYSSHWVFRHEDVYDVLNQTETFVKVSPTPGKPPRGPVQMMGYFGRGLFSSDPPQHTRLRGILGPLFHEAIEGADAGAAELAETTLQNLAGRGRFELVSDYALPVPANVLFTILGIPNDEYVRAGLLGWQGAIVAAHDTTAPIGIQANGATARMALHTYLLGYVAMAQTTPPPKGVIGGMCKLIDSGELSATDVALCAADFIIAGYLSTTYLIASGIRQLQAHPDQFAALRADPDGLMGNAVQEMLRFDAPAQLVDRVAAVDTEIAGVPLAAGAKVCCVLGAADHDPQAFDAPDEFRIDRDFSGGNPHISFGSGIHTCIGAPLVGLVGPAAMKALMKLPGLAVDGIPQWQSDPYLRGMLNLPVRVA